MDRRMMPPAPSSGSREDVSSSDTNVLLKHRNKSESLKVVGKKKRTSGDARAIRKTMNVAWAENVFVLPAETEPSSSSSPSVLPQLEEVPSQVSNCSVEALRQPVTEARPNTDRQNVAATASRRQSIRIDNKGDLTKRWSWNQELVAADFMPYKKMLADGDELLPSPDQLDSFQFVMENQGIERVLTMMLEDGELHEREIAAFFEGLALYDVKLKALQFQIGFLQAEKRAQQSQSVSRSSPANVETKRVLSVTTTALPFTASSVNQVTPTPLSVRAVSIQKVKIEKQADGEVQRLLAELEEAEKKQRKLEQQLRQAGIVIAEDISFDEARAHVERISKRMQEIGSSDVKHEDKEIEKQLREEYFRLEQDMERYNAALVLSDEYAEQQKQSEQKWEDDNKHDNVEALKKVRRCMPVNVKCLSEAQLCSYETPNGRHLPDKMAKKFKRTNVLQLIRTSPEEIARMHPSTLENLRVTGLTLTERRAIHAHLKGVGPVWEAMQADPMTERKWTWYKMMKQNFKENLSTYQRHVDQHGPPGNHAYATRQNPNGGCPLLGNQCPLRANAVIDYDDDYGYSDEAEYEVSFVNKAEMEDPGAKAAREALEILREKKASQRVESLKRHYKGKVLQVSLASGSCVSMDEVMDRMDFLRVSWMEESLATGGDVTDTLRRDRVLKYGNALQELKLTLLRLAGRSGMQLTGKKDSNADQDDCRSPIELFLAEEVCETCVDFFQDILHFMSEINAKDTSRIKSTIGQLRELLDELHERNVATLKELDVVRPGRSRRLKSRAEIKREVIKSMHAKKEQHGGPRFDGGSGRGNAGGPLSAPAGRGRGGRGDLMSAIAGRGRGGRSGGA